MSNIGLLYVIEGGKPVGGAEQILLTIIKKIDKAQYKIRVCLLIPSDILEGELKDSGIPVFILNMKGKWDISSIFKLVRFMHTEKIDIVHTSLYASNTVGRIAAILARLPVIIAWEHKEIFVHRPVRHYLIDKILARFTDSIVACSNATKEELIKREGISSDKIRVIYNSIDPEKFNIRIDASKIRKELGIKPNEVLVGNVASLANKIKGQEYLIKTMPQIVKFFPKVKLLLVGEGPSKLEYIQRAKSLNISDRVIFTGFRRDMPQIINTIDLYVCSSIYEALPISIIEAMSLKKPVVATDVGGICELVIQGETGYLVPPKDTDALAQAITQLLADRDKMRRMGEAGFKRIEEKFSLESIIKEIEAFYKELLCRTHPRSQ